jgi:hypothetical protein
MRRILAAAVSESFFSREDAKDAKKEKRTDEQGAQTERAQLQAIPWP